MEPLEPFEPFPSRPGDGDLYGVSAAGGVGREGLEPMAAALLKRAAPPAPPGENLEGTVPARARRPPSWEDGGWTKPGKPSVGDSGMFSRRGVELPLVGGPAQGFSGFSGNPCMPSWAWISRALEETVRTGADVPGGGKPGGETTYLLGKSLLEPPPPISWDGEPEPDRVGFAIFPEPNLSAERPNGDRRVDPPVGSLGEWLVAGEVDRPWAEGWEV